MTLLLTLLSHWKRQPVQLIALIGGLAVATALWSGVQALNAQARGSYDAAAALLGGDRLDRLVARTGTVALSDHVALRRAGWQVSPVIEGRWRPPGAEASFRLLGIDAPTLPREAPGAGLARSPAQMGAFMAPPHALVGAPETLSRLPDDAPPEARRLVDEGLPEGALIADISLAQTLLDRPGAIDYLIVAPVSAQGLPPLGDLTGDRLVRRAAQPDSGLEQLTESFHLNLTAFGLLSFVVGLFIVHATVGLAFEQRRAMFRTLLALGQDRRALILASGVEMLGLALIAGALGMVLGYLLAAALLEDVAATLSGLYGASVPGQLALAPGWWLAGIAMTLGGTAVAAFGSLRALGAMPVLATAGSEGWRKAQLKRLRFQGVLAAALGVAAVEIAALATGLVAGFALMGAVLMAAAFALPGLLALILGGLQARAKGPLSIWFLAESRAQIGGLSLALMALLLALAVNIGVGTMVSSFRETFIGWLDKRLTAELYLRGKDAEEAARMESFLTGRDGVIAVLPVQNTRLEVEGYPYELFGIRDNAMYRDTWPLIRSLAAPWDRVAAGDGVLISEQFARARGIGLGDPLSPAQGFEAEVVGIYPDYGNPIGQAITSEARLKTHFPRVKRLRFAVRTDPARAADIAAALETEFSLGPEALVNQSALKAFSRGVFERTFAVTLALNVLTFAVAGFALLSALLTLGDMRLPHVAPLWALGVTRARLARLELLRALVLALVTALLAVPLGVLVAWILLSVINVEAFGWRIPQGHYPAQWLALIALAVVTAGLAAAWPARRLWRTPAARLLRVFSDAR